MLKHSPEPVMGFEPRREIVDLDSQEAWPEFQKRRRRMKALKRIASLVFPWIGSKGVTPRRLNTVGMPIWLGDEVARVRAALGTTLPTEPCQSSATGSAEVLRLESRGIHVFFDQAGRSCGIRLEAPFSGRVSGMRLGDHGAELPAKLGRPAKRIRVVSKETSKKLESCRYDFCNGISARFEIGDDQRIAAILLGRPMTA